jgi:hypothetical protein
LVGSREDFASGQAHGSSNAEPGIGGVRSIKGGKGGVQEFLVVAWKVLARANLDGNINLHQPNLPKTLENWDACLDWPAKSMIHRPMSLDNWVNSG